MATLIVAIHSNAFYGPWFCDWVRPILSIAVPVFFILSSMFYFRKVRKVKNSKDVAHILGHFLKRLGIFYLFWFIINLPKTLYYQHYFIEGGLTDILRLTKDFFLYGTFAGSWFLSALALSVTIFTLCFRCKPLRYIALSLSILLLFYVNLIGMLPDGMKGFYAWWQTNVCQDVRLTVLTGLPWVGIGLCLSSDKFETIVKKLKNNNRGLVVSLLAIGFILAYVLTSYYELKVLNVFLTVFLVIALVLLAGSSKIAPSPALFRMRKISTMVYVLHFLIITIVSNVVRFFSTEAVSLSYYIGNIGNWLAILAISIAIAEAILYLSKFKYFRWLKYAM